MREGRVNLLSTLPARNPDHARSGFNGTITKIKVLFVFPL